MAESLPVSVPFEDVKAALASLGIPTERVMTIMFTPKAVTVTQRRVNEEGASVAVAPGVIATVATEIAIDRGERA